AACLADVGGQRRPTPILVREVRREPVLHELAASHGTNAHITHPVRLGASFHDGRSVGHPDELRGAVDHGFSSAMASAACATMPRCSPQRYRRAAECTSDYLRATVATHSAHVRASGSCSSNASKRACVTS